jgi:hypothetical protein
MVPVLLAPPPCAAAAYGSSNPSASAAARVFIMNFISTPPEYTWGNQCTNNKGHSANAFNKHQPTTTNQQPINLES